MVQLKRLLASFLALTCLLSALSLPALAAETSEKKTTLTEFESKHSDGTVTINGSEITLSKQGGDHHALLIGEEIYRDFVYEADVELGKDDGSISAALVFGVKNPDDIGALWFGANINKNDNNGRIFKVGSSGGNIVEISDITSRGFDFAKKIHMRLTVAENGSCTWQVSNIGGTPIEETGKINGWRGGYIGLLTFDSSATFSNVTIQGTPVEPEKPGVPGDPGDSANPDLKTNLAGLDGNEAYTKTSKGLHGAASGKGDQFIFSTTTGKDFVYEADVTFLKPWEDGAAALTFRSNSKADDGKQMYVANLNGNSGETRVFKFGDRDIDMGPHGWVDRKADNTYHLKVTVIGTHITYYVDDNLVLNTADYTMHNAYYGQNDAYLSGTVGLMTWNTDVVYQNVTYTELNGTNSPELKNLSVASNEGKVDKDISFHEGQYVYITYVSNSTKTIKLNCTKKGGSTIIATDETGKVVDINRLPVTKDFQTYTLTSEADNGAKVVYRVRVHRCQPDETYYNEDWRGQFHYSVKDGWANDPNGMVFYKGTYHLFYQYYDGATWGTMHWAHATSKDLIHWEERPIELYPDEYGVMFSGPAVVANHATAPDIFAEGEEGIVLLITANGERGWDGQQKVTVAYSKDGETFQKYQEGKVILHWEEDPLKTDAFRDPKVFRYQNKWFLVIAGGPLRIYSSNDLVNWQVESVYGDLHTECPDLYPLAVKGADGTDTGEVLWVLDRGGRKYKIGDFKQGADGKWGFVPLAQYASPNAEGMGNEDNDGIMNFGPDSYAAMTYYMAGPDVKNSFTGNKVIEINWMNTWAEGFNNAIPGANGNYVFNGTFNLQLELGIKKDADGKYYLTQTPIEQYETLRDDVNKIELENATIGVNNDLLKDFSGDSYEIAATITPNTSKEFGFKVRTGEGQETVIKYADGNLVIDRSKSGVTVVDKDFMNVVSQPAKKNADGSFTFHIYVDRACVEVFNEDYTVAGAMQIFPSASSRGLSVYSDNGSATGDITVYPLNSIWKNTSAKPPFADVRSDAYYFDAVTWAVGRGITSGTSASTFSPDASCTRAQIMTLLWRAAGSPKANGSNPFTDVAQDSYYYNAVLWAAEKGITSGTSATTFSPEAPCIRAQAMTFLYRVSGDSAVSGTNSFDDVSSDAYYAAPVQWAVSKGITYGTSASMFSPDMTCSRAQIITFLFRMFANETR